MIPLWNGAINITNKKEILSKLLLVILLLILSVFCGLLVSSFLILSVQGRLAELTKPATVYHSIMTDPRHALAALVVTGMTFLMFCYICFWKRSMRPVKVDMLQLTPSIEIPKPAGQNQHGSARFASKEEEKRHYTEIRIDSSDKRLQILLSEGKDDAQAIKTGEVRSSEMLPGLSGNIIKEGGLPVSWESMGHVELVKLIYGDVHTVCFGATRCGKTRTLVIQSVCLQALAGVDFCCSDPKGELYQYTYPFVRRLGYVDFPIDFKNPKRSVHFNFLQFVIDALKQNDISKAIQCCWDFVDGIVKEASHSEPLWTNGEKGLLAAAVMQVVYENSELGLPAQYPDATPEEIHQLYEEEHRHYQNCINLYHYISKMAATNPATGNLLLEDIISVLPEQHPSKLTLAIAESAPSKTRGSFITSALATLRLFTDPNIADLTSSTDMRLLDPNIKKAIYVILPDDRETYYPLASLFVNQYYQFLAGAADRRGGRLLRDFEFDLDEFGNFTKIPFMAGKMTVAAGRGIHFHLYLQSKEMLVQKYDKETASIILENCHYWIYLKSDGLETLKMLSEKMGKYTVLSTSSSASLNDDGMLSMKMNGSSSTSTQLIGRPLMDETEIGRIERPYLLVFTGGYPSLFQIPDLHKWQFNTMLGMGDPNHNIKLREMRENMRPEHTIETYRLWDFTSYFNRLLVKKFAPQPDPGQSLLEEMQANFEESF